MKCSCAGMHGLGADEVVTGDPGFDLSALSQFVLSDAQGRIQWKPAMVEMITTQAGSQWIAQDYFSDIPVGARSVRVVVARAQAENPGVAPASWPTDSEPVTAADYMQKMAQMGYNVCASYGWVVPSTEMEKLLIHVPVGDAETLRVISMAAPILSALPADLVSPLDIPSESKPVSTWSGMSTTKKVAVIGGGGLVLAAVTGLLGPKWKLF